MGTASLKKRRECLIEEFPAEPFAIKKRKNRYIKRKIGEGSGWWISRSNLTGHAIANNLV